MSALKHDDQPNDGAWEAIELTEDGRDMAKADLLYWIDRNELAGFDSSDSMLDYFIERYIEQVDAWTLELTVPSYLSRDNKSHVSAYSVGDGEAREI